MKAEAEFIKQDSVEFVITIAMTIKEAKTIEEAIRIAQKTDWHSTTCEFADCLYDIINKVRTQLESEEK